MLLFVVLAAALPLALDSPCPPAPTASKVCGSDLVTYPSQCHLQCAAVPGDGVTLRHSGACSAVEEEKRWDECSTKCDAEADCGCGADDVDCKDKCERKCHCGCGGYSPSGMNTSLLRECLDRRCWETNQCEEGCGGKEECSAECSLDYDRCECECLLQAQPAPQRKGDWTACLEQHQCHGSTCSECTGADPICAKRCERRCQCECAGHPWRDLLSSEWEECFVGTQTCEEARRACRKRCRDQDCRDKCDLDSLDCSCVCHSATEAEWHMWNACRKKEECVQKRCQCDEFDTGCRERCRQSCSCSCLGMNVEDRLDDSVQQCQIDKECRHRLNECLLLCGASDGAALKECKHRCFLVSEKCLCECGQSRPTKLPESKERVKIVQHCNFIC